MAANAQDDSLQFDTAYSEAMARLMASENIQVQFANVEESFFDVNKRVLVVPNRSTTDKDVSDLILSGEVAHALYDDPKVFNLLTEKYGEKDKKTGQKVMNPQMKAIYDMLSDARAEKLIKRKFQGLKPTYAKAYRKLANKDFFGINDIPEANLYETLSMTDRLNLFYKAGHHYSVPFDWSEKPYVDAVGALETSDDILRLAEAIYKQEEPPPMGGEGEDEDESEGDGEGKGGKGKGKPQKDQQQQSGNGSGNDADDDNLQDFLDSLGQGQGQGEDDGKDSQPDDGDSSDSDGDTDDQDQNPQGMYDNQVTTGKTKRAEIGSTQKSFQSSSKKALKPPGTVTNYSMDFSDETWKHNFIPFGKFYQNVSGTFFVERANLSRPMVNYMFKQFETKRRAHEYQKVLPSKNGGLDPAKLFKYSYDDQIFSKKTLIQDSKNHGIVILIDYSGSMNSVSAACVKMCLDLILFCQKAGIKYSVLAFTDSHVAANGKNLMCDPPKKIQNTNYFFNGSYKLVEMLSSKMNRSQLMSAVNWLSGAPQQANRNGIGLGGTPLNDALVQMPSFLNHFRKVMQVEILNFVTISDGDSNALGMNQGNNIAASREKNNNSYYRGAFYPSTTSHYGTGNLAELYLTDTASRLTLKRSKATGYAATELILQMIKKVANVKTACLYVTDERPGIAGLQKTGAQIIAARDNTQTTWKPLLDSATFRNAMGYDAITFVSSETIKTAKLADIEKSLKVFIDVIS